MVKAWHKMPSVKQLQCFCAVVEELNFRRAAERLNMSQPPLTRQIQLLEALLGCPLFYRDTRQVSLTAAGKMLAGRAADLLLQLSALRDELSVAAQSVRIGVTRTLDFSQIAPVSSVLEEKKDAVEVNAHQFSSRQLLARMAQGELDLALIGEKPAVCPPGLRFLPIWREPLMLALPSAHGASLQPTVSLTDVADLTLFWFARSDNPAYYDKCEGVFSQLATPLKRQPEPADTLMMLSAIAQGNNMALIPQSLCKMTRDGLCYRTLDETSSALLNIDIWLVMQPDERRLPVLDVAGALQAVVA
ncbi:hypothetical protein BTJ39_00705 [Izhakiella australiensis]|uniref:HTH lysR-type domain-containing protein n=1 Tax=Izhakiella australiensis TaxID=1926881 RepID=A0A1S8YSC4_9GAMM|nr:LysR family transcriptional regulator [Izhakiella australiensis]OON41722.1 hypothetical protein BTJ39_00705 [Izhakiella australiensis]